MWVRRSLVDFKVTIAFSAVNVREIQLTKLSNVSQKVVGTNGGFADLESKARAASLPTHVVHDAGRTQAAQRAALLAAHVRILLTFPTGSNYGFLLHSELPATPIGCAVARLSAA